MGLASGFGFFFLCLEIFEEELTPFSFRPPEMAVLYSSPGILGSGLGVEGVWNSK